MWRANSGPCSISFSPSREGSGGATSGIVTSEISGPAQGSENAASASAISFPSWLMRADSVLSERPSRSSVVRDLHRPGLGCTCVVDRQRARRARGVGDCLDQRAQQDRREVAAVRAAPGAPVGRHLRAEQRLPSGPLVFAPYRRVAVELRVSHGRAACT